MNELRGQMGAIGDIPFTKTVPYCMDSNLALRWDNTNYQILLADASLSLDVAKIGCDTNGLNLYGATTPGTVFTKLFIGTRGIGIVPTAQDSIAPYDLITITPAAHTNLSLNEMAILRTAAITPQWVAGTLSTQRFVQLTGCGIAGAGALTVTKAATLYVDPPTAGTNATLTHPYAVWSHGDICCDTNIMVGAIGPIGLITVGTTPTSSGLPVPCIYMLHGPDTNITASAELVVFQSAASGSETWNTGAITNQRFHQINAISLAFNGASTVTHCANLYVELCTAGANATITNNYAAWFTGQIRVDSAQNLGGGAAPTLGTIGGTGPAVAAQNQWLQINVGGNKRFIPLWA